MLLEFAAKQQVVPLGHMFGDAITSTDSRQLRSLVDAAQAMDSGQADGPALCRLLRLSDDLDAAGPRLRSAAGAMTAEQVGMALALAYVPFQVADAFAVNVIKGATLKSLAAAIDPRSSIPVRSRLFLADNLRKDKTLRGVVACAASVVILRENGPGADGAELVAPDARERLRRLALSVRGYHASPAKMAAALRYCLAHDWWNADGLARHVAIDMGIEAGETFANPPAVADLVLLSLMPTCDTIDAAERLLAASPPSSMPRGAPLP
ncbi:MAG: hypothetical protein JO328_02775 [Hyphomicrobiales bacterium]|nr:hypothetical protein [Hyphomicrobiales bacterium]MBV8825973.1 hypothetical protein [Hyphomicrobiales bacterium]MBV9428540.1 hypothetical protein [Bradyrhizobiaceae bacterium]